MALKNTLTLKDYLNKTGEGGKFIIPNYQRGYIWGKDNPQKKSDNSVTVMIETLLSGFKVNQEVFIQGLTVYEENNENGTDVYLVDGQQRTTFFYLLLKWLHSPIHFEIDYSIRKESQEFLSQQLEKELSKVADDNYLESINNEEYQDIFFFKKTLFLFHKLLSSIVKKQDLFLEYILNNVRFLYIPINKDQASTIFTMMNGQKAKMKDEELVKSEILRCSSMDSTRFDESENNAVRSRFAREWDRWMYWWNRRDVYRFFYTSPEDTESPRLMGWLLPLVMGKNDVSFTGFRMQKLRDKNNNAISVKEAKATFKQMRMMQNKIEDAYYTPLIHNYMGAILCWYKSAEERFTFLHWFFNQCITIDSDQCKTLLKKYFDWSLLGVNHKAIIDNDINALNKEFADFSDSLESDNLYNAGKENCFRWLLCRNIREDNEQGLDRKGRLFDFEIWKKNVRSLEHIFPKSKVWHLSKDGVPLDYDDKPIEGFTSEQLQDEKDMIRREDIYYEKTSGDVNSRYYASEHSIGNLVLLYKNDNSEFNNACFDDKKIIFFGNNNEPFFKSRHLIHTIKVFAQSKWDAEIIARNKEQELLNFSQYYQEYLNNQPENS